MTCTPKFGDFPTAKSEALLAMWRQAGTEAGTHLFQRVHFSHNGPETGWVILIYLHSISLPLFRTIAIALLKIIQHV